MKFIRVQAKIKDMVKMVRILPAESKKILEEILIETLSFSLICGSIIGNEKIRKRIENRSSAIISFEFFGII